MALLTILDVVPEASFDVIQHSPTRKHRYVSLKQMTFDGNDSVCCLLSLKKTVVCIAVQKSCLFLAVERLCGTVSIWLFRSKEPAILR